MRNKLFLSYLIILTVQFAFAQTEQSLLWEISGKKIKKTSYLYGTIHIQDKRVFDFDSTVINAFDKCQAYAMELVLDEIDKEALQKTMLMEDRTLKDILSEKDYKSLDSCFKAKTGSGILMYEKMKPFMIYSQLSQIGMKQDMELALDAWFLDKARKMKKSVFGIEKLEDQLGAIDMISLEEQAKMLMNYVLDTSSANSNDGFDQLLEAYLNADLEKMVSLAADTTLPKVFADAFLINRNKKMADNIEKIIKKQSSFNAIGAAHLGGPNGVIALLREKGYTLRPVHFKFEDK